MLRFVSIYATIVVVVTANPNQSRASETASVVDILKRQFNSADGTFASMIISESPGRDVAFSCDGTGDCACLSSLQ